MRIPKTETGVADWTERVRSFPFNQPSRKFDFRYQDSQNIISIVVYNFWFTQKLFISICSWLRTVSAGHPKSGSLYWRYTAENDLTESTCQIWNFGDGRKYWNPSLSGHMCVALQTQTVFGYKMTNWIGQPCNNVTSCNAYVCQKKIHVKVQANTTSQGHLEQQQKKLKLKNLQLKNLQLKHLQPKKQLLKNPIIQLRTLLLRLKIQRATSILNYVYSLVFLTFFSESGNDLKNMIWNKLAYYTV